MTYPGFEPDRIIIDELANFDTEKMYVIAASEHAAAILAVQIWKSRRGQRGGMIYPLESDALRASENQPMPMRKRYFPFKVSLSSLGFVTGVQRIENKSLDRNKSRL